MNLAYTKHQHQAKHLSVLLGYICVELIFHVVLNGNSGCSQLEGVAHQVEHEGQDDVSNVAIEASILDGQEFDVVIGESVAPQRNLREIATYCSRCIEKRSSPEGVSSDLLFGNVILEVGPVIHGENH